jgi:hypothetical protein
VLAVVASAALDRSYLTSALHPLSLGSAQSFYATDGFAKVSLSETSSKGTAHMDGEPLGPGHYD